MKVILLNHIEKLGSKGEVVSVKRGFARNYLIPRNLAIYATSQNMKHLSSIQNVAAEEEAKLIAELKKLDDKIRKLSLVFVRKVDENDSMFGSVAEMDIVQELAANDITVHKSMLLLEKHIKTLGETIVEIRLHKDIVSELKVLVEKEAKEPSEEAPEITAAPAEEPSEEVQEITPAPAEEPSEEKPETQVQEAVAAAVAEPETEEKNLTEDEK